LVLFATTGIGCEELITLDIEDIDWKKQKLTLKPQAKRANNIVFEQGKSRNASEVHEEHSHSATVVTALAEPDQALVLRPQNI
jgi:integrase